MRRRTDHARTPVAATPNRRTVVGPDDGPAEAERRAIEKALRETDGNKAKTARRLGLTRTQS